MLPSGFVKVTLFLPLPGPPFFFGGGLLRRDGAGGLAGTKLIKPSSFTVPRPSMVVPGCSTLACICDSAGSSFSRI